MYYDVMTESEALQEQHDGEQAWDDFEEIEREQKIESFFSTVNARKARYEANKAVAVGEAIACACCAKPIVKRSYQTQFCSNKGAGNCKDRYWNCATPKRRNRLGLRYDTY
jgi:hypothetical protein